MKKPATHRVADHGSFKGEYQINRYEKPLKELIDASD